MSTTSTRNLTASPGPFFLDESDPWRPRWFRRTPGEPPVHVAAAAVVAAMPGVAPEVIALTRAAAAGVSQLHEDYRSTHDGRLFVHPETAATALDLANDADAEWMTAEDALVVSRAQTSAYWSDLSNKLGDLEYELLDTIPCQPSGTAYADLGPVVEAAAEALRNASEAIWTRTHEQEALMVATARDTLECAA